MKILYTIINEQGFALYSISSETLPTQMQEIGGEQVETTLPESQYTTTICSENLVRPKFENGVWVEGATVEELLAYHQSLVPREITPRQFKLALLVNGISPAQVENFINTLSEPDKTFAMINWQDATTFKRSNEMINAFAPQMGLSQLQLDEIFILGNTFE